jgi:ubiquinone/menaquinone biosynthesis C-methylase UbiE/DNA-binding transcriptional ArsR family regulator
MDVHVPSLFRLLGDEARLRMLRLLDAERLNVSELTGILGIAQSGVSRHLGLLKDAGLLVEDREGGFSYYRIAPSVREGQNGFGPLWPLLHAQFESAADTTVGRADNARLAEVRRLRKENFDAHGGPDTNERQLVPGRSWAAWSRALGLLLPPLEVADLGCGDGYLTIEAARWAARVVAIDRSPEVLGRGRELAARRGVGNITWKRGELESLPLPDASVDVALLSQALHHAEHPPVALAEAVRILRPGGRVLVLDLRSHDQAWVHERLGDRVRGFKDEELARLLEEAGLAHVQVRVGARLEGDPFTVLIAAGSKNADLTDSKESPRQAPAVTARVRSGRR